MRPVLEVYFVGKPTWLVVPKLGLFHVIERGYYAQTKAELVGPFEGREAARRIAYLVTRRRLQPGAQPVKPFKLPRRVIEL